jgi:hypothetical protein
MSGGGAGQGGAGSTFPPANVAAAGPFKTTTGAGGPSCTIFRPATLGEEGRRHPVIVWGNGTTNTPSNYAAMFTRFASHGFIVTAANTSNAGSGKEMLACLDYVITQNGAAGTPFEGHVDVNRIAASGYSQGGAGALLAALDKRIKFTALVSPYVVIPLGAYDVASAIPKQTATMFMISGSADAVAVPNSNQKVIFDGAKVPIVWGTFAGADHLHVLGAGGGSYGVPLTAWFRYTLMDDPAAADWFKKTPCKLCMTTGWTVKQSSLWTN